MQDNHVVIGKNKRPVYSRIATHPGEVLKDEIEARKLIKTEVAKTLEIQPGHLSELFKGKRNVSPALAIKLQKLLDIPAENWLMLQNRYDLTVLQALETAG
jgi:antitoxin HigA-1